jgi:hypothetical protein
VFIDTTLVEIGEDVGGRLAGAMVFGVQPEIMRMMVLLSPAKKTFDQRRD